MGCFLNKRTHSEVEGILLEEGEGGMGCIFVCWGIGIGDWLGWDKVLALGGVLIIWMARLWENMGI